MTSDPEIMAGKPVIKGTRLTVVFILNLPSEGAAIEKILLEYGGLKPEDIQACIALAERLQALEDEAQVVAIHGAERMESVSRKDVMRELGVEE